jgi:hypothetical protein
LSENDVRWGHFYISCSGGNYEEEAVVEGERIIGGERGGEEP